MFFFSERGNFALLQPMPSFAEPCAENDFLADHLSDVLRSYRKLTGKDLVPVEDDRLERARQIYEAPFFVASHDMSDDPVLNYGNRCAQELFAMSWEEFTSTPSRYTAEAPNREERERLLENVRSRGFIDDYSGVRISSDGRRFRIRRATVWDVSDSTGEKTGQAATFSHWDYLG